MVIKKVAVLVLVSALSVSSFCACSVNDLKGNTNKEEGVADKDKLYENWMSDTGISFNEHTFSAKASAQSGSIAIESGKLKRKGIEIFNIKGDNTDISFFKKQDMCYLRKTDGGIISSEITEKELINKIKKEEDRFTGGFGNEIKVLKSKYIETVKEGREEYDIVRFKTPDYKAQEKYEEEMAADQKVSDDGDYGNDVGVIIGDGKECETEEKIMEAEAYVDKNGDITKILWPVSGNYVTYNIKKTEEDSFEIKNPAFVLPEEFLSIFMKETAKFQ